MRLDEAIDRVASASSFLLGVDFDGTLAPLVERPEMAVADPEAVELLIELARRDRVGVAIVSGRSLDDLRERLGEVPGASFVGEHGNDLGGDVEASATMKEATAFVDWLQREMPEATVEHKRRSVTFHTRNLSESDSQSAQRAIRDWCSDHEDVTLLEGKEVFELTTATRNKGDAIGDLAGDRPVIYIGDDTTDETVFEVLGEQDVGIKVGEGPTAARFRVEDVAEVVRILEKIALASG